MDSITDEEKKVVEELRSRTVNDVTLKMKEDPSIFYRFAKARDFNLVEAETMLRKHIAWRKEIKLDTILTDYTPSEVFLKYAPVSFLCFDKAGCIVRIHDCGRADSKGLLNVFKKTDMVKYVTYCVEKDKILLFEQSELGKKRYQLGKPILSPIYDFEGLTYAKAVHMQTLQLLSAVVKSFMDNYPEYLRTITVINAPFYFTWIYAALKPLLPDTIIQKVRIYGSDGWKEQILQDIDANDLPAYLGGNRTDPDGNPLCETFILRGQPVPKEYYIQKGAKTLASQSDVEKLTVMPFSKEEISFNVKEDNTYLEWEFETKSRDIEFTLLLRVESSKEVTVLIPKQRIDTCDEPEKGCFKCEKIGRYTIVFDNSYSWFHSKEVYYKTGIKSPKIEELFKTT